MGTNCDILPLRRNLDVEYARIIDRLAAFLREVRAEMDRDEKRGEEEWRVAKRYAPVMFQNIDEAIYALEDLAIEFDDVLQKTHSEYLQRMIHPVALKSPFNRRCFEKPRGYAGDYMTMEMIYSDPWQGDSIFARLLNLHSLRLPLVEAVRGRYNNIRKMIAETVSANPTAAIFSVGSGPAWEVREFLRENEGTGARFFLLDHDREALQFVYEKLGGGRHNVSLINQGAAMLAGRGLPMKFDLIYSMGLFDYLPQRFAARLIRRLAGMLGEGGRLVVGNASLNPHRVWMEHGSEWYLIYRNKEELLDLARGLRGFSVRVEEGLRIGKMFMFLVIER